MGAGSGRDSAPERRGGEEKGEAAPTAVIDEFFEVRRCQSNGFVPSPLLCNTRQTCEE